MYENLWEYIENYKIDGNVKKYMYIYIYIYIENYENCENMQKQWKHKEIYDKINILTANRMKPLKMNQN